MEKFAKNEISVTLRWPLGDLRGQNIYFRPYV